jgi:hypothetical protein
VQRAVPTIMTTVRQEQGVIELRSITDRFACTLLGHSVVCRSTGRLEPEILLLKFQVVFSHGRWKTGTCERGRTFYCPKDKRAKSGTLFGK